MDIYFLRGGKNEEIKSFFFGYRVTEILQYTPEELIGKNLYTLCHAQDAEKLKKSHLDCKFSLLPKILLPDLYYFLSNQQRTSPNVLLPNHEQKRWLYMDSNMRYNHL